jgi:SpoVK/Ycf46/Vps4 family AAA+-type ATPase
MIHNKGRLFAAGPPGVGKSLLVRSVAKECGADLRLVSAGDVMGSFMGESERRLRTAFADAEVAASETRGRVVILFFDEIDALCPRRTTQRQHEARVVAQLLTLLDGVVAKRAITSMGGVGEHSNKEVSHVVIIGATNRPNALDPALRRPGRLDREIAVPVPDTPARSAILRLHAARLPLAADVDLDEVAGGCFGFSGADLASVCREAAMAAVRRAAAAAAAEATLRLKRYYLKVKAVYPGKLVAPVCSVENAKHTPWSGGRCRRRVASC